MKQQLEFALRRLLRWGGPAARRLTCLLAAGVFLLLTPVAHADLIFSINDVTAAAGSTGNTTLEVSLTNSGASSTPQIAAFEFQISVPGASGVTFTDADIATVNNPYIFGTNTSTPPLSIDPFPNTGFTGTDLYTIPSSGVVIGAGQTVGLGRVTFAVAPSAIGLVVVTMETPSSDPLADQNGDPIAATYQYLPGSILVTPFSAVPEPSSLVLGFIAMAAAYLGRRRFQRVQSMGGAM